MVYEHFDAADLASRGWYDMTNPEITTEEAMPVSQASLRMHFNQGANVPDRSPGRHLFEETEVVVPSFWIKYSAD